MQEQFEVGPKLRIILPLILAIGWKETDRCASNQASISIPRLHKLWAYVYYLVIMEFAVFSGCLPGGWFGRENRQ